MYGVVTKYYRDKGYGYIQDDLDGTIYFLHKKNLNESALYNKLLLLKNTLGDI